MESRSSLGADGVWDTVASILSLRVDGVAGFWFTLSSISFATSISRPGDPLDWVAVWMLIEMGSDVLKTGEDSWGNGENSKLGDGAGVGDGVTS